MAFPSSNAQADVTKKILEDIQIKKQLLQKGVSPVTPNISATPIPQYVQATSQAQSNQPVESTINATTKAVYNQALSQSYGFFIPQDSLFGNNIIPVLPRFDNTPTAGASSGAAATSSSAK